MINILINTYYKIDNEEYLVELQSYDFILALNKLNDNDKDWYKSNIDNIVRNFCENSRLKSYSEEPYIIKVEIPINFKLIEIEIKYKDYDTYISDIKISTDYGVKSNVLKYGILNMRKLEFEDNLKFTSIDSLGEDYDFNF